MEQIDLKMMMAVMNGLTAYNKQKKDEAFQALAPQLRKGQIVFLGDSITEGFPLNDLFPDTVLYNRGIGGDKSADLLARLPYTAIELQPKKVFILIGTNDLKDGVPQEKIVENVRTACESLLKEVEGVKIFVVGVYPVCLRENLVNTPAGERVLKGRTQEEIIELNEKYRELCETLGMTYLNWNSVLTDGDGNLREEYTSDGLHLNIAGYCAVTEKLKELL